MIKFRTSTASTTIASRMSPSAVAAVAITASATTTTVTGENNNFIQSSSAKLKTITVSGRHTTTTSTTNSINSRGLIRYSFYVLVPLSAIAAIFFCKCNKNSRAEV